MLIILGIVFSTVLIIAALFWTIYKSPFDGMPFLFSTFPFLKKLFFKKDRRAFFRQQYSTHSFFASLSEQDQDRFIDRSVDFLTNIQMTGMDGLVVTDEHRLKTAYAAVRVAWGHMSYNYPSYESIEIYPDYFKTMLKGRRVVEMDSEVTSKGQISLAWEVVRKGFEDETDGVNSAFFVFAETMYRGVIAYDDDDFLLSDLIARWNAETEHIYLEIRSGHTHGLPTGAGRSRAFFFAYCVELFLENPKKFQEIQPKLYPLLARTLNHDPQEPTKKLIGEVDTNRALAVRQYGRNPISGFAFPIMLLVTWAYTLHRLAYLALPEYVSISIVGGVTLWRIWPFIRVRGGYKKMPLMRLAGGLAMGFAALTVVVVLNDMGRIGPVYEETHRNVYIAISQHTYYRSGSGRGARIYKYPYYRYAFVYENNAYSSCALLRRFDCRSAIAPSAYSKLTFQRGWLGIPILLESSVYDEQMKFISYLQYYE